MKLVLLILCLFSFSSWAHDYSVSQNLQSQSINISFETTINRPIGCRLDVVAISLRHPNFEKGTYGEIALKTKRSHYCKYNSPDWGNIHLKRGPQLPGLIWGPYNFTINDEFITVLDWSIRGGCETGNGAPRPCF